MQNPVAPCCHCGNPVEIPMAPPKLYNNLASSIVLLEHSQQVNCSTCGVLLTLAITALQGIGLTTTPVPVEEQPLITKPSGRIMRG